MFTMDLVSELCGYLIANNYEKVSEFETRCLKLIDIEIENHGSWHIENLIRDKFAECFITTRIKADILEDLEMSSHVVMAGRYGSNYLIFIIIFTS